VASTWTNDANGDGGSEFSKLRRDGECLLDLLLKHGYVANGSNPIELVHPADPESNASYFPDSGELSVSRKARDQLVQACRTVDFTEHDDLYWRMSAERVAEALVRTIAALPEK
jgi:hypothetical protein